MTIVWEVFCVYTWTIIDKEVILSLLHLKCADISTIQREKINELSLIRIKPVWPEF